MLYYVAPINAMCHESPDGMSIKLMSRSRWSGGLRCETAVACLLGTVRSNHTGNMDVCLLCVCVFFFLVEVSDVSSEGVLQTLVCLTSISKVRDKRL